MSIKKFHALKITFLFLFGSIAQPGWSDNWTTTNSGSISSQATTNVGIGVASPTARLDISGTIKVSGVSALAGNVNINGATDFTGYSINVAGGNIANTGGRMLASFGSGVPGDANNQYIFMQHDGSIGKIWVTKSGTGVFRDFAIYTGDTERYRVTAGGAHVFAGTISGENSNLGISGNASLTGRLNFGGATDATGYSINSANGHISASGGKFLGSFGVGVPGSSNSEYMFMQHDGAIAKVFVTKSGTGLYRDFAIYTSDFERYRVTASGAHVFSGTVTGANSNLSISGNESLSGHLNIGGASDSPGYSVNVANGHISASNGKFIGSYGAGVPGSANSEYMFMQHDGALAKVFVTKSGTGIYRDFAIYTGDVERYRVTASGSHVISGTVSGANSNLAISGNSSVSGRLNIGGASDAVGHAINIAGGNVSVSGAKVVGSYGVGAPGLPNNEYMFMQHDGAVGKIFVTKEGNGAYRDFAVYTGDAERYRVSAAGNHAFTGNVSIGGVLTVGTIVATTWQIGSAPDYVFEKDYDLPPLRQVAAYVKENKHLPDVPSARKMKEEGLDLVKMNFNLLRKVEELTLYAIEHDERAKAQDEKIRKLEALVEKIAARK